MNKLKLGLLPISALVLSLALVGCVNTGNGNQAKKKTLADISLNIEPAVKSFVERPQAKENASDSDVTRLIIDYKELAQLTDDPKVKEKIALRLAELQLIDDEHAQEVGSSVQDNAAGYFDNTIAAYQALLKKRDCGDNSEHLLYQLAKAYELQGEGELSYQTVKTLTDTYPIIPYAHELHFISGEYLFSQKKYALASDAYKQVVETDSKTSYFQTALYMLAWSEFKLEKETQALNYFSQLLDLQLPTQASNQIDLDKLPIASQGMVKDTLRVMSLIFSYRQGADSLVQHYLQYGARYYEYLNYESLAEQFIDDKRYQDSTKT
ncbi:MAG: tetratricopeptide repeat protein [Psychrobium sp.]|nr:tetratricopeptide repeat protein [Psychrobium sp.]